MALLEEFKQWENGVWTHNGGEFEHDPMYVVPDPSDSSKFDVSWKFISGLDESTAITLSYNNKMKILRRIRDEKIAETDWWASADVTLTDERKAYRKTLRDLPSTMTQNSDFDNFIWPTKPS